MSNQRELLTQSLFIVASGIGLSFSVLFFACEDARRCSNDGSCVRINLESTRYLPQCNYKRVPGLVGAMEYLDSSLDANASESMEQSLRAYCSPGERLQTYDSDDQSSQEACTPQYTYPNSISIEIETSGASSYSEKYCGAWIQAGRASGAYSASYWAFSGTDQEVDAINEASMATVSTSLSRTSIGKVAEKCEHTVLAGDLAILQSAKDSYQYLVSESGIESVNSVDSALTSLGTLIGHYCDGPVTIGWNYAPPSSPGAFMATMYKGASFSDTAVGESLTMVGENTTLIQHAVQANSAINERAKSVDEYPSLSTMTRVYEGASGRTDHDDVYLEYGYADELVAFQQAISEDSSRSIPYLKAVAATCSFVVSSSLNYAGYTTLPKWSASYNDLEQRRKSKPFISSLGRLSTKSTRNEIDPQMLEEVNNVTMHNATSASFSQLVSSSFSDPDLQCSSYVSKLFPDALDAEKFSIIYTGDLYTKMEILTRRIQKGVSDAVRENETIRKVLQDPDLVADDIMKVRLRIPGAPRRTWAGADRNLPFALFDSKDSFFKMVLKQARSLFLDRQSLLVFDSTDVCDGPSVMDSMTANAYIYPSIQCSYYLLGLSLRPFLDAAFDEESLLSRFGYVYAHELAHSTLNTPWINSELEKLLHRYTPNTYSEAIADIVAGMGLMRSNQDSAYQLSAERLCGHVAQSWCARVGSSYYSILSGVHPLANQRGDYFCETLLHDLGF